MTKFNDSPQAAFGWLTSQLTHIEREAFAVKYPDITYPELVPVDTSANQWAKSVTYWSTDMRGKAEWLNGRAHDVPLADIAREKFETAVQMAGIGYDYTLEEINQSRYLGQNLTADKSMAARRAYEEMVERIAFFGDTTKGFTGLTNNASVTVAAAAAAWSGATVAQILGDINGAITGIWTASKTVELADTILLPLTQFSLLTTKQLDATIDSNLMSYIIKNNIYTAQTGSPLKIRAMRQLATAGASSATRMIAYRRDPTILKMHLPMPLQFLAPQQEGFMFKVPGMFRLGGVDVKRPGSVRFTDGI